MPYYHYVILYYIILYCRWEIDFHIIAIHGTWYDSICGREAVFACKIIAYNMTSHPQNKAYWPKTSENSQKCPIYMYLYIIYSVTSMCTFQSIISQTNDGTCSWIKNEHVVPTLGYVYKHEYYIPSRDLRDVCLFFLPLYLQHNI